MNSMTLLFGVVVLTLLASLTAPLEAARTSDPFYIIAHMANSQYSLDWAVQQGANAIEADIQFDDQGSPYMFEHRGLCDCSCLLWIARSHHICSLALKNKCSGSDASNDAKRHLQHIAKLPGVAMLLIDSKVEAKWGGRLRTAGDNIVALLEQNLFSHGFRGKVAITVGNVNCFDYLSAAAQAASRSQYSGRYYFTFDQMGDDYHTVAAMLSKFTKNRLFGTGTSACLLKTYKAGIRQAVSGVRAGEIGLSYIWTLDRTSSMETYIDLGVQGIITNKVAKLKNVAATMGLRLATPEDPIPVATRDV